MKDYVAREYIENLEMDKMIYEDKELYENIVKKQLSEDTSNRIIFATITIILGVIKFVLDCRPPKDIEAYRILDIKMTDIIRKLVDNENVKVYLLRATMVNAFNLGTPDIYYTDKFIKLLNITENELIGVCLHEYGHYFRRHGIKTLSVGAATGIIIPILLREIVKEFPMIVTFFLGKFLAFIVSSHLKIIISKPQEYFSDSYATKKGYGKYLISVLNKTDKYIKKIACKDNTREDCEILLDRMRELDDHPAVKDRVDNILKSSKIKTIISGKRFGLLIRFLDRIKGFFRR